MAIAVADSKLARNNTALASMNFAAGDCLVVFQSWDNSTGSSCTDNNGNSYTTPTYSLGNGVGIGIKCWVFGNQSANAALVVQPTNAGAGFVTAALKVTGATTAPLDTDTPNGNFTASASAHTTTTAGTIDQAAGLVLSALAPFAFGVTTWTASGFTKEQEEPDNGTYYGLTAFSQVSAALSGTASITSVPSVAGDAVQIILVLKEGSSGDPTVITKQPAYTQVAEGATATFTVEATGTSLTYQWQDNRSGSFANVSDGTGGTTASYTTTATTQLHQGRLYRCVVTGIDVVTSGSASLGVVGFRVHLWSTAVPSGNDVWLRDPLLEEAGGGGLTASLGSTEADDAAASAAFALLAASLASSEAGDSLASAANATLVANTASTEGGDAVTGAAGVVVIGTASAVESGDGVSSASLAVIGLSLAATEVGDASSAAALAVVGATAATVEQGDVASSAAVALISASLASIEYAEALSSTAVGAVAASLTATEMGDGLSAAATGPGALTAELSATESNDAVSGAAAESIAAALASSEYGDSLSSAAEQVTALALNAAEEGDGLAGVSAATATATLAAVEQNESLASALTAVLAASLDATEGPEGLASTVAIALMAALDSIEANDNLAASAYTDGSIAAVWEYVLSNGKTAEQNVVEIRTMLDTVLDNAPLEGSLTAGDLLRVIAAVQAGKTTIASGAPGEAHVEFTAVDGTDVRVAADMTGSERTDVAITL